MPRLAALLRDDRVVLAGLLLVAAALRLVDLPTRGTWDSDQGHDMLILRALIRDGEVPLLGPPTSIGDVHHGAWYYYLLAPSAVLGGASPEAIALTIALAGVAAVGVTWWVGRALGGPIAGLVAGLAMAVSASAIEESTFIWNPNLIPLSSSLALAGAVAGWRSGRAGWWLLAALGLVLTMQLHVLGLVFAVPFAALFVADLLGRRGSPAERPPMVLVALGCVAVLGVAYLPLVVHELATGFSETEAFLAYLREDREAAALGLPARILFVAIRTLSWPLTGLVTDALGPAVLVSAVVITVLAWRSRAGGDPERTFVRWMAATLAWCAASLALIAPSLATVVPGLPNDHYHAFLDPIVFVVVGLGAAGAWRTRPAARTLTAVARGCVVVALGALVLFNASIWPPAIAYDHGWPAAREAAERVERAAGSRDLALVGIPDFKPTDAIAFPLVDRGMRVVDQGQAGALVVVCDRFFEEVVGADCGGPAEEAAVGTSGRFATLVDRFDASPRTSVSVYVARDE